MEDIKQMIDKNSIINRSNEFIKKAKDARINALENKIESLESFNTLLEKENQTLREFVEFAKNVFDELNLAESKKE